MPHFTQEQWFELVRFALLPALFWAFKKAVTEMRDTIDTRADAVAKRRDEEVLTEIHIILDEHEKRDQERFQTLHDLILAGKRGATS